MIEDLREVFGMRQGSSDRRVTGKAAPDAAVFVRRSIDAEHESHLQVAGRDRGLERRPGSPEAARPHTRGRVGPRSGQGQDPEEPTCR